MTVEHGHELYRHIPARIQPLFSGKTHKHICPDKGMQDMLSMGKEA